MAIPEFIRTVTIYVLCDSRIVDPVLRVRYVGQTWRPLGARLDHHLRTARFGNKEHRAAWVRAMIRDGAAVQIVAIDSVPLADADAAEVAHIARYRALGCDLTNRTNGGKGHSGIVTDETRRRMSTAAKRRGRTPAMHAAIVAGLRASDKVQQHMKAMHEGNRGMKRTAEARARMSRARRGEECSLAVLTWDAVDAIRAKYAAGIRQAVLVREYGVSPATIHRVVHRNGWIRV